MISYRDTRLLAPLPVSKIPNFEGGGGERHAVGTRDLVIEREGGGRKGGKPGGEGVQNYLRSHHVRCQTCRLIHIRVPHHDSTRIWQPLIIACRFFFLTIFYQAYSTL